MKTEQQIKDKMAEMQSRIDSGTLVATVKRRLLTMIVCLNWVLDTF